MRRLFLPLPTDPSLRTTTLSLANFLVGHVESSPGQAIDAGQAETLILQGSVWFGNQRIKDPAINVNALFDPAERERVIQEKSSGHSGRKSKSTKIHGVGKYDNPKFPVSKDDDQTSPQEMRYGPWLQVFYPEKPIQEYSLDPAHIKYEDADLLIVYKEAMLNTCQSVFSDTNCLTWGVQKYLDSQPNRLEPYQLNTINRLDYATRGLVFYAKHKTAEVALHRMFMNRHIHKRYLVVTPYFRFPDAGELANRTPPGARVRGGSSPKAGFSLKIRDTLEWQGKIQESATLIKWVGTSDDKSRLFWIVLPQTGRTHQIRKHFARYLVPILGDPLYGPELYGRDDDLMLACIAYRFRHPISGKTIRVEYLPPAIQDATPL